eukprot:1725962-Ditylum_brightwellii.AAC.1
MDKEYEQGVTKQFGKVFNKQLPLLCNPTMLDLIAQVDNFPYLASPLVVGKVHVALCCMANGKAPGPSDISSGALKSMVWWEEEPNNNKDNDNDVNHLAAVIHDLLLDIWEAPCGSLNSKECQDVTSP